MSDTVIRVENLSKHYRLGVIDARTLHDDLARAWARLWSQPDPLWKIGEPAALPGIDPILWALRDVSLDIRRGEVVGIIGRNGAGKSTLLKILSRITAPSAGQVKLKGHVASLLEVGTGFHPELTGRENIYLNGAILGMRRQEINRKFDEIVSFSGVERFIDTPVKRYSSGMYVRLAFAVAAHLEPEILIVDEVLAVGDVEFQRKCLGKMGMVAKEGRTVLFVTHNLAAVSGFCTSAVLLNGGRIIQVGATDQVIGCYLTEIGERSHEPLTSRSDRQGDGKLRFTALHFLDGQFRAVQAINSGAELVIALDYESSDGTPVRGVAFEIGFYDLYDQLIFLCGSAFAGPTVEALAPAGRVYCRIPHCPLPPGAFTLNIFCGATGRVVDWVKAAATLHVAESDFFGTGRLPPNKAGVVFIHHSWDLDGSRVDTSSTSRVTRG